MNEGTTFQPWLSINNHPLWSVEIKSMLFTSRLRSFIYSRLILTPEFASETWPGVTNIYGKFGESSSFEIWGHICVSILRLGVTEIFVDEGVVYSSQKRQLEHLLVFPDARATHSWSFPTRKVLNAVEMNPEQRAGATPTVDSSSSKVELQNSLLGVQIGINTSFSDLVDLFRSTLIANTSQVDLRSFCCKPKKICTYSPLSL